MINKVITVPIRTDKDGYFDKQCPNTQCKFEFKVDNKDWKNIFKDEAVYCPKCGHSALAKNFTPLSFVKNATIKITANNTSTFRPKHFI